MYSLRRQVGSEITSCGRRCRWQAGLRISSRKLLHTRPDLPYPEDEGVGSFLPPEALKTVLEWQEGLLNRLNGEIKDDGLLRNKSVVQTVVSTAADRSRTLAFNYASLALNNSFFLDSLKPPTSDHPNHEHELSRPFRAVIEREFGSLSELKRTVAASAAGMASSGWIWLAMDARSKLAVLPTFGSGTLLVRSRMPLVPGQDVVVGERAASLKSFAEGPTMPRESGIKVHDGVLPPISDGPTTSSPVSGIQTTIPPITPHTQSRSLHSTTLRQNDQVPSILDDENTARALQDSEVTKEQYSATGASLYPLFCLSIHEHAWMSSGLGVWGREEYVNRFWDVLDWSKVDKLFVGFSPKTVQLT